MHRRSAYLDARRCIAFILLSCLLFGATQLAYANEKPTTKSLENDQLLASEVDNVAPGTEFSVLTAGSVLQLLLSLLVIVALIMALAWYARKIQHFSMGKSSLPLRVVAATAVGAKERVVLVQVGEEQLLLGVAPGQVTLLSQLDTPIALDQTSGDSASFIAQLRKVMPAGNSH